MHRIPAHHGLLQATPETSETKGQEYGAVVTLGNTTDTPTSGLKPPFPRGSVGSNPTPGTEPELGCVIGSPSRVGPSGPRCAPNGGSRVPRRQSLPITRSRPRPARTMDLGRSHSRRDACARQPRPGPRTRMKPRAHFPRRARPQTGRPLNATSRSSVVASSGASVSAANVSPSRISGAMA